MGKIIPLEKWSRYGALVVLWECEYRVWAEWWKSARYEKCLCDCGNIKRIRRASVRLWHTKSCWCISKKRIEEYIKSQVKHWDSWTRLYNIYLQLKGRCTKEKNPSYWYYWWRWIKCERNSYEDFKKDMWDSYIEHCEKYWEKNTTIDRIDVDWNYCKENCRWATWEEQRYNKRESKKILRWWNFITLPEIYNQEFPAVSLNTFRTRVNRWWWITEALFTPNKWCFK